MMTWTGEELAHIGAADELELAALRRDNSLRKSVTIWVVRHGDDLYVRSVNGRTSSWFRGVEDRHEARIRAGGVDKDVLLVEADGINDEIDAAYQAKYGNRYPTIVPSIVAPQARKSTLKLVPRTADETSRRRPGSLAWPSLVRQCARLLRSLTE